MSSWALSLPTTMEQMARLERIAPTTIVEYIGALLTGLGLDRPARQQASVSASVPFINISTE